MLTRVDLKAKRILFSAKGLARDLFNVISREEERLFIQLMHSLKNKPDDSHDYCQVLCVYKRSTLKNQIKCLLNQSSLPSQVLIYHNESHIRSKRYLARFKNGPQLIRYTHNSNWNAKYHGRFYACLAISSPWYIVWDDDIEPGSDWNICCLEKAREYAAIITANGRIINKAWLLDFSASNHEIGVGDGDPIGLDTLVDYGGHSWTFSRDQLIDMASIDPPSLDNSEDLHLSAAAYIRSKTNTITYCPRGNSDVPDVLKGRTGGDQYASFITRGESWGLERQSIIKKWITYNGFTPVADRSSSSKLS
jgi:hypothetical protein